MTRGRHPVRALEEAETIAKKRGLVRYYERGPGLTCNFSIVNPEILAQVRIMRMRTYAVLCSGWNGRHSRR